MAVILLREQKIVSKKFVSENCVSEMSKKFVSENRADERAVPTYEHCAREREPHSVSEHTEQTQDEQK